jgi:hypothetical protein
MFDLDDLRTEGGREVGSERLGDESSSGENLHPLKGPEGLRDESVGTAHDAPLSRRKRTNDPAGLHGGNPQTASEEERDLLAGPWGISPTARTLR